MKIQMITIRIGSEAMRGDLADYLDRSRQLDPLIKDCRKCVLKRLPQGNGKQIEADVTTRFILGKCLLEHKNPDQAIDAAFSFWEGRKILNLANPTGVAIVVGKSEPLIKRVSELSTAKHFKSELTLDEMTKMLRGATVEREVTELNRRSFYGPPAA